MGGFYVRRSISVAFNNKRPFLLRVYKENYNRPVANVCFKTSNCQKRTWNQVRKSTSCELSPNVKYTTLNSLHMVWEACSYLESPPLPFDPVQNERIHPSVEVGEIKENSSESNNCKGNEFQNPEENTSPRPPYLGWGKKASYPGHNSISFSSKCRERSSGEKSKVLSNKRSFQGCNVLTAPSSSSSSSSSPTIHYHCLQARHSQMHRSAIFSTDKINK